MKHRHTDTYSFFLLHPLFHAALILVVGLLAYRNSFSVPFVFDDLQNIADNPYIKDLRGFSAPAVLLGNRPVGLLSFAVNYYFHGLNVTGYHAVNLAVHLANALLVHGLTAAVFTIQSTRLTRSPDIPPVTRFMACAAALLFVSHPIQTGAVTYTVQRFTLLATFFYLLSLILYLIARSRASDQSTTGKNWGRACYAASLMSCLVAMKCKEISFTIPIMITLAEFMFFTARPRTRINLLLPFLLTLAVIPLSRLLGAPSGDILQQFQQAATISRPDYLLTQFRVLMTYLRLLVLPIGQNIDYDFPVLSGFFQLPVMASFLFHATVVSFAAWLAIVPRDRYPLARLISFGVLWFYVTLIVESSIIPLDDLIFEHRVYLPSVGFFLACVATAGILEKRWVQRRAITNAAWCLLGGIVITFAIATYQRNIVWQSGMGIWQDAVRKSPLKSRPHYNLGCYLAGSGDLAAAIREFQSAVRLDPNNSPARNNLGTAYVQTGNIPAALREFREAVIVDRTNATAHFNLGYLLAEQGQTKAAINELQKGLQLEPANQAAIKQLKILSNLVRDTPSP